MLQVVGGKTRSRSRGARRRVSPRTRVTVSKHIEAPANRRADWEDPELKPEGNSDIVHRKVAVRKVSRKRAA